MKLAILILAALLTWESGIAQGIDLDNPENIRCGEDGIGKPRMRCRRGEVLQLVSKREDSYLDSYCVKNDKLLNGIKIVWEFHWVCQDKRGKVYAEEFYLCYTSECPSDRRRKTSDNL